MLLGGLWHGAAWTFVVWGFLHGSYLVLHRLLLDFCNRRGIRPGSPTARLLSWLGWPLTIALVWVAWVVFRAADFHSAWTIVSAMLGFGVASAPPLLRSYVQILVWGSLLLTFAEPHLEGYMRNRLAAWGRLHFCWRGFAYAALTLAIIVFGGSSQKFIYFDF
jgi:hypothetical protein